MLVNLSCRAPGFNSPYRLICPDLSGLTAWDTQAIKEMYLYELGSPDGEIAAKASIYGALPALPGLHQHVPVPALAGGQPEQLSLLGA